MVGNPSGVNGNTHAIAAILSFAALTSFVISAISARR
jgi:hypothetical protein